VGYTTLHIFINKTMERKCMIIILFLLLIILAGINITNFNNFIQNNTKTNPNIKKIDTRENIHEETINEEIP
jgi:hypothetical protein